MERTIKVWLSIIFPGLLGFVASCLVILPQLVSRGMGDVMATAFSIFLAGCFAVLFSRMLSRHVDEVEVEVEDTPKAATSDASPFAVATD